MPQDQEHPQPSQPHPQPQNFWDFIPAFIQNQNRPGNGVDHHNPQPAFPAFSGGFPFAGPFHHGPPHPHHPPHGPHSGPPHPPPPPGVGRGPWDAEFDWGEWHGPDHSHGRRSRHHGCRRRGRHHRHCDEGTDEEGQRSGAEKDNEKGESPETMDADMPDPEEVAPEEAEYPPPPYGAGRRGGRGFRGGAFRRGGRGHHGPGPWGRQCRGNLFDFPAMMRGFMNHPFFQNIRDQAEQYRGNATNDNDTDAFSPPVDVFNTETSYVVHVALPGVKKEDVGVNWNPDSNTLNIAGVAHRPGDEAFIQSLVSGERRVGMFERDVKLPPVGVSEKDDVDGLGITARMEDGVLVVVVPKVEREWTEIRKVDVQ